MYFQETAFENVVRKFANILSQSQCVNQDMAKSFDVLLYSGHYFRSLSSQVRRVLGFLLWVHYNNVIMSAMASQITSPTIVYSTVYSGAHQRNHQNFASLAFLRGIHWWPVNSPHKRPVTRKIFPFDDVIMWNFDQHLTSLFSCCLEYRFVLDRVISRIDHIRVVKGYVKHIRYVTYYIASLWWLENGPLEMVVDNVPNGINPASAARYRRPYWMTSSDPQRRHKVIDTKSDVLVSNEGKVVAKFRPTTGRHFGFIISWDRNKIVDIFLDNTPYWRHQATMG